MTTTIRSAYRPAIALPGQRVTINIAGPLTWNGRGLNYMGAGVLFNGHGPELVDKAQGLYRCRFAAVVIEHDGRVSYLVNVSGVQIRVHECNIVEVL